MGVVPSAGYICAENCPGSPPLLQGWVHLHTNKLSTDFCNKKHSKLRLIDYSSSHKYDILKMILDSPHNSEIICWIWHWPAPGSHSSWGQRLPTGLGLLQEGSWSETNNTFIIVVTSVRMKPSTWLRERSKRWRFGRLVNSSGNSVSRLAASLHSLVTIHVIFIWWSYIVSCEGDHLDCGNNGHGGEQQNVTVWQVCTPL